MRDTTTVVKCDGCDKDITDGYFVYEVRFVSPTEGMTPNDLNTNKDLCECCVPKVAEKVAL